MLSGDMLSQQSGFTSAGAPEAQWVKGWPTDLADLVRSLLETKSSHPEMTEIFSS